MDIAVLADVHGNLPGLEAVLADLKGVDLDSILVAGDLTGGPFPNETIERLIDLDAVMIAGNSDLGLIRYFEPDGPEAWRTRKQFGLLRWNATHISPANLAFLRSLPEQRAVHLPGAGSIRIVHGTPWDPFDGLDPEQDAAPLDRALGMLDEPVLVCGHTHQPWFAYRNGKLAINPGAVAGPLNGEVGAQYARLKWDGTQWQVSLLTVPYDLASLREAFYSRGLLEAGGAVARGFLFSIETGENVTSDFLEYAFRMAAEAGYPKDGALPDEIWDQATESFPWPKKGR